jgi:hypothetical protein
VDDDIDTPYRSAPSTPITPPMRVRLDLDRGEHIERILPIGEGTLVATGKRTMFVSMAGDVHPTPLSNVIDADASGTVFLHRDTLYASAYTPGLPRALATNVHYLQALRVYGPYVYWIDLVPGDIYTSPGGQSHLCVLYKARRSGGASSGLYSTDRRIENLEVSDEGVSWTIAHATRCRYSRDPHGEIPRKQLLQHLLDAPLDKVRDLELQPPPSWYDWLSSVVLPFTCWTATAGSGVAWMNPREGNLRWTLTETGATTLLYSSRRISAIASDSQSIFLVDRRKSDDYRPTLLRIFPDEGRIQPMVTFEGRPISHKPPHKVAQECLVISDNRAYFSSGNELFWSSTQISL